MWLPVMLLLTVALAFLLWFLPVQVRIALRSESWEARLQIHVKAGVVTQRWNIDISENAAMVLEHVWKRWRATGEPVQVPLQKTIRRLPRRKLLRVLARPARYLGRHTQCRHLEVRAEMGGGDAMESALLAGTSWAVVGAGVSLLSRAVRLDPAVPRIVVIPMFRQPMWRVSVDCILKLRLGHAMVAGVWLLRRGLKEREVVAWLRDSLRRRGEKDSGGTSDSGPDEDGHGVD